MIHHDSRDYATAASAAAAVARTKMQEIIHKGQASAGTVIQEVLDKVVTDRVVRTNTMGVYPVTGGGWGLEWDQREGHFGVPLHRHAFQQVLQDAELPKAYVDKLEGQSNGSEWGKELVAHNLNTIFSHRPEQRNLVREEKGLVKGFLSDKFRRIDSRPLLESFVGAAQNLGLVPIEGVATDVKVRVRAVLPEIFEPVDNECMLVGLEWGNSDYGAGGHVLNLWMMRMWCTNLAIGDQVLRQVHLGKRLADDISYSQQTYELDTATNVSAVKDTVAHAIGPARVNAMMEVVKKAGQEEIKGKDGISGLLKKYLDKGDLEKAVNAFESPDVVNLPPGNTVYRASNVLSWLAQGKDFSAEKKLEFQAAAGKILGYGDKAAKEV